MDDGTIGKVAWDKFAVPLAFLCRFRAQRPDVRTIDECLFVARTPAHRSRGGHRARRAVVLGRIQPRRHTAQLRDARGHLPRRHRDACHAWHGPTASSRGLCHWTIPRRGAYGEVVQCQHRLTRQVYAIKVIAKGVNSTADEVRSEMLLARSITSFETADHGFIAMELVSGGTLRTFLAQEHPLPEEVVRRLAREALSAIHYLHSIGVAHLDLKTDNMLVDKDGRHLRLADFGISVVVKPFEMQQGSCGTVGYMAPEVAAELDYGDFAAESFSLGVVIYEIANGCQPFEVVDDGQGDLMALYTATVAFPRSISDEYEDLVRSMLRIDPDERLLVSQAIHHQWVTGYGQQPIAVVPVPDRHNLPTFHDQAAMREVQAAFGVDEATLRGALDAAVRLPCPANIWSEHVSEYLLCRSMLEESRMFGRMVRQRATMMQVEARMFAETDASLGSMWA
ncbi:kinase-like domain-containing protein [Entophlyctis helioformis]|nr:kinase-like domain-containing protein [Entophlyctis helioformis]